MAESENNTDLLPKLGIEKCSVAFLACEKLKMENLCIDDGGA